MQHLSDFFPCRVQKAWHLNGRWYHLGCQHFGTNAERNHYASAVHAYDEGPLALQAPHSQIPRSTYAQFVAASPGRNRLHLIIRCRSQTYRDIQPTPTVFVVVGKQVYTYARCEDLSLLKAKTLLSISH